MSNSEGFSPRKCILAAFVHFHHKNVRVKDSFCETNIQNVKERLHFKYIGYFNIRTLLSYGLCLMLKGFSPRRCILATFVHFHQKNSRVKDSFCEINIQNFKGRLNFNYIGYFNIRSFISLGQCLILTGFSRRRCIFATFVLFSSEKC